MGGVGEFCSRQKTCDENTKDGGRVYDVPLFDEAEMKSMCCMRTLSMFGFIGFVLMVIFVK